jgi:hypothetical protein
MASTYRFIDAKSDDAMAGNLTDMFNEFERVLKDKQAEITAADVRLGALRSAEHELRVQLAELQEELAATRVKRDYVQMARKSAARMLELLETIHV